MEDIAEIFNKYQEQLDEDHDKRELIKEISKNIAQLARDASNLMQIIHEDIGKISEMCASTREMFIQARDEIAKLKETVPPGHYYKYHEQWKMGVQTFCFLATLVIWLEKGILADNEVVAEIFGFDIKEEEFSFHLDIEDYLFGLLMLSSELSRFAVTSVSNKELQRPQQISKFMMELAAGFRLFNLKNDFLRKRYDAMKYDVKKVEEVIYDLSIRNMLPTSDNM